MSISRYQLSIGYPQPVRKIKPAATDIIHTLRINERLDNLSYKYYDTPLNSWIIMSANPAYLNEFEIPPGAQIRIPYPLQRVLDNWMIIEEV